MSFTLSDLYDAGTSECCDAPVYVTGFCASCGEHAEAVEEV